MATMPVMSADGCLDEVFEWTRETYYFQSTVIKDQSLLLVFDKNHE